MIIDLPIANHPKMDAVIRCRERFKVLRKGRRVGVTRSKAHSYIEDALSQKNLKFLWVDTVHRNIDRYYERFFLPPLKLLPKGAYAWNAVRKTLYIYNTIIDFGSAERPENLEGFGYNDAFLNEAGIILQGESGRRLWEETIRPMLADKEGSALIAGVPKGVRNNHFCKLWEETQGRDGWGHHTMTTYESPYVTKSEVDAMVADMMPVVAQQEIFAQFVDFAATDTPWLFNFDTDKNVSKDAEYVPGVPIVLSFDFNIEPMVCTMHQLWFSGGVHHWHTFDEVVISNGSVPVMIQRIRAMLTPQQLSGVEVTGDATGVKRDANSIEHITSWRLIQKGLNISASRMKVPKSNPSVSSNRELCNFILHRHGGVKVHPRCKTLIFEAQYTEADNEGGIPKKNRNKLEQRADALDTWRYVAGAYLYDFDAKPMKYWPKT